MECAILQELAEIKREVRALRAQSATQIATAVPLEQAASMLGCKRAQVFKLLKQSRLERAPKVGRTVLVTMASIRALIGEGAPRKRGMQSRRSDQQPKLVCTQARTRQCEKSTKDAERDPGSAIRQLSV
ncbi:hypothetical protein D7Y27_23725 [Corallococcus sp. AB004]|nr:hypothetical protein D7Y27_23725 [Corallococcus sp. AB004]